MKRQAGRLFSGGQDSQPALFGLKNTMKQSEARSPSYSNAISKSDYAREIAREQGPFIIILTCLCFQDQIMKIFNTLIWRAKRGRFPTTFVRRSQPPLFCPLATFQFLQRTKFIHDIVTVICGQTSLTAVMSLSNTYVTLNLAMDYDFVINTSRNRRGSKHRELADQRYLPDYVHWERP